MNSKEIRKNISNTALMLLLILYVAGAFTGKTMNGLSAAAGAVVLVLNIPFMGKTFQKPAWVFCALGVAGLLFTGAPLSQWIYGMNSMMKTVVILIAVQTLSISIKLGNYENAVADSLNTGIHSVTLLFCILLLLSHLLAGVMSLGSVVVILAAIMPAISGRLVNEKAFAAEAIMIGYCTLFLWAPGTVTVLMSMQVFDLSWGEYFLPAFGLAVLGLVLGIVWGAVKFRRTEFLDSTVKKDPENRSDNELQDSAKAKRKLAELALVLILIVVGISLLEKLNFSNASGRMTVTSLVVSLVWLVLITGKRFGELVPQLWWDKKLPNNMDMYVFFLSMGLFSAAVSYSGFETKMMDWCNAYLSLLGVGILPILPLVIILLSLVGIHPFISVLMVGPVIAGMSLPVSALQLGLAMSLGCCLSYMVSPFAGLILTMANNLELSPAEICFKINLKFAMFYFIIGEIFILLVGA